MLVAVLRKCESEEGLAGEFFDLARRAYDRSRQREKRTKPPNREEGL